MRTTAARRQTVLFPRALLGELGESNELDKHNTQDEDDSCEQENCSVFTCPVDYNDDDNVYNCEASQVTSRFAMH